MSTGHPGGSVVRQLVGIVFCTLLTCCSDGLNVGGQSGQMVGNDTPDPTSARPSPSVPESTVPVTAPPSTTTTLSVTTTVPVTAPPSTTTTAIEAVTVDTSSDVDVERTSAESRASTARDLHYGIEPLYALGSVIDVAPHPDGGLYAATIDGTVHRYDPDSGSEGVVLDIGDRIRRFGEAGLLSVAVDPGGGWLYLYYSTLSDLDTRLAAFPMETHRADPDGEVVLLDFVQPAAVHNGGGLLARPDGTLWLAVGDGGQEGDPEDRAQDPQSLFGKLLRIVPTPWSERSYEVPSDNPFVDVEGVRAEIWSLGLRNVWRFDVDPETGDVWTSDVGEDLVEEVNFSSMSTGGENYGWARLEGTKPFRGTAPEPRIDPLVELLHGQHEVCSMLGGLVYRGGRHPELDGAYLFFDFCQRVLYAAYQEEGELVALVTLTTLPDGSTSVASGLDGDVLILGAGAKRPYRLSSW